MKKILILLIAIASLLFIVKPVVGLNEATTNPTISPTPYPTPVNETLIVSLINKERLSVGLDGLKFNYLLGRSAQLKADEMCKLNYFAHTNPNGDKSWDSVKKLGYDYYIAGENLARNHLTDFSVFNGFKNSPTHYALIIDGRYEDIGIGRCEEYLVVHFGKSK